MPNREVRCYEATEVRALGGSGDADPLRIEGYAATFGVYSRDLGGFREKIKNGAFNRVISERQDVRCLFNHDASRILGRTTAGTLQLAQDHKGLFYRCTLPNTQFARDVHESIQRGDISQCSFSFTVAKDGQNWGEDRDATGYFPTRELTDVDCFDVSPVTYPAYEHGTNVQARAAGIEVPMEIRSAVDAKNAALITPPAAETRSTVGDPAVPKVPDSWKQEVKDAFVAAFKEAWNKARNDGKKGNLAYSDAASAAYAAISEMLTEGEIEAGTPESPKREEIAQPNGGEIGAGRSTDPGEKRAESSFEDINRLINSALAEKFGYANGGWPRYYVIETYATYIIACCCTDCVPTNGKAQYVKIPYTTSDADNDGDVDAITLGDGEPVKVEYVPDEDREAQAKIRVELRKKQDEEDDNDLSDVMAEFDEEDLEDRGEVDPAKLHTNHTNDGNCVEPGCGCQNRFGFHKNQNRGWDPKNAGDVADKIDSHIRKANRHANIAEGAKEEEVRSSHLKAAESHAKAAEAHAGLAGQTKEDANGASAQAEADSDAAVRCSMRSNDAFVAAAKGEAEKAGADVAAAHAEHLKTPTDQTQKGIEDAHAVHAAKSRAFDSAKDSADNWNAHLHGLSPASTASEQSIATVLDRSAKLTKEVRSVTTRTKRVDGKDLPASAFAYVGDADKTETWKFPVHDKSHADNALSRWGQDKGIPEGSKAGVFAKIKSAAEKFGTTVAADDAKRSAASDKQRCEMLVRFMEQMGPDAEIPEELRGGPGSGPQGGRSGAKEAETAGTQAEHEKAAAYHTATAAKSKKDGFLAESQNHKNAADAHSFAASHNLPHGGPREKASELARDLSKHAHN